MGAPLFSAQHWEKLLSQAGCSAPWGGSVPVSWEGSHMVMVLWAHPGTAALSTCGPTSSPMGTTVWRC